MSSAWGQSWGLAWGDSFGAVHVAPPDVAVWTERTSGTSNAINAVAYGSGLWVAVGDSGTILTSPDGVTWTARVSGTTNPLRDVIFAQGKFVACANVGFLESTDGITWSAVPFTGTYTTYRIAYANNTWAVLAANSGNAVWTSEDFETWTVRLLPVGVGENFICKDIVFGNGVWVVVGSDDYNVGRIYTSANLTDWSLTSNGLLSTTAHYSVGFGDGEFVAGWQAEAFGTPRVRVSPDGYNWTTRVLGGGVGGIILGVGYGNGVWVAVGSRGTAPMLYTSQDAITWTERSLPIGTPNSLTNAAYAPNMWLVVSDRGAILTAGQTEPVSVSVTVTGVPATGQPGAAQIFGSAELLVTGVASTGQVGTVQALGSSTALVTGVVATTQITSVEVVAGANVLAATVFASGTVGTVVVAASATAFVLGASAEAQVGRIPIWSPITADPGNVWTPITADPGNVWAPITLDPGNGWTPITPDPGNVWTPIDPDATNVWTPVAA